MPAMESPLLRQGCRRAAAAISLPMRTRTAFRPVCHLDRQSRRHLAVPSQQSQPDSAGRSTFGLVRMTRSSDASRAGPDGEPARPVSLMARARVVPASPSYFTATPRYMDDVLHLSALLRKYQLLPQLPAIEVPKVAWKKHSEYQVEMGERIRMKGYSTLLSLLKRLNSIHPSLIPLEVTEALEKFKRLVQPNENRAKPILIDEWGRASAVGRRKASSAKVYVVEGTGECLVNGRRLMDYFGRIHDRESALWPLKATERLDKYNVWALVRGGGTTGQAEAITLGLARALLAHEPALKSALRRAGVVARDPREVERKKPGHVKARKMPTWVKR